jgi:hypothetical protein
MSGQCEDTLHVLHTARKEWNRPHLQGPLPTPRHSHSGCSVGTTMYIFGGQIDNFYLDDIAAFDMKTSKRLFELQVLAVFVDASILSVNDGSFLLLTPIPCLSLNMFSHAESKVGKVRASDRVTTSPFGSLCGRSRWQNLHFWRSRRGLFLQRHLVLRPTRPHMDSNSGVWILAHGSSRTCLYSHRWNNVHLRRKQP